MRIGARIQRAVQAFFHERTRRVDTQFFIQFVPKKIPSMEQFFHIRTFLSKREKNIVGAATLCALIGVGGMCTVFVGRATTHAPAPGGSFTLALTDQPATMNPLFATTETDRTLTRLLFLPLCDFSQQKIATLATSCDMNAQKTRATITLQNRQWHDGELITAEDVVFTFGAMANTDVGSPWYELASRVTVKKIDDTRVVITATHPLPALGTLLTRGIIPEHVWKVVAPQDMKTDELNLKPVGSGPFQYDSVTADSSGATQLMTLTAFENFAPTRAYLDSVRVHFVPDTQTAEESFRSRQIDALTLFGHDGSSDFMKRDVARHELVAPIIMGLFFNPLHFADAKNVEVRRAFATGIDRTALIKNVFKNDGTPARAAFPASVLREPSALEPVFDAAAAAALFKKYTSASTTTPARAFTLGVPSDPLFTDSAAEISKQLTAYGVPVTAVVTDPATDPASVTQVDAVLMGQNYGETDDPLPFWHSSASAVGGANYARYQMKSVDQLLEQLQTEPDSVAREKILQKINTHIVADLPAVFLVQPSFQFYVLQKFHDVAVPPTGTPETIFSGIEHWYTATRRVWHVFDK